MIMSALASLPARAAERVKALNAGAPHLAAAATSTLRKADLLSPSAAALLSSLSIPDLLQDDSLQSGLTLREARLVYKDTTAVIATLANMFRRIVWRDIFAAHGVHQTADGALVHRLGRALRTLGLMQAPDCAPAFLCLGTNSTIYFECALCEAG